MDQSRWPERLCKGVQSTDETDSVRSTFGRPATAERRATTATVTAMWARSTPSLSAVSCIERSLRHQRSSRREKFPFRWLTFHFCPKAVGQNGHFPWYGERCSAMHAVTYSSNSAKERKIATTDIKNQCTIEHSGTSAAAPLASGRWRMVVV